MGTTGRPGPKPKRLYLRLVRFGAVDRDDLPPPRAVRAHLAELDRVGRLVADGPLTEPPGALLILRAEDAAEARRVLRTGPYADLEGTTFDIFAWNPTASGSGVNLEPPPARGAGRLTLLQRVAVVVRSQERSLPWYEEVLGLTVRARDAETGYLELALGKGTAALSLIEPSPSWGEPYYSESVQRIGSRTGIVFETDSVPALELRLRHAGSRVTEPAAAQPWGGVSLRFTDPDGNEFLAFQRTEPPARPPTEPAGGRRPGKAH